MVSLRHIFKFLLVSGLGLGLVLTASALTLGRVQGAAWIGQALDLRIPVQFDQESTEGGLCPQVDIFDGDSRQDPAQIKVTLETASPGDNGKMHIVSAMPIDEPVVTVYLRVGCSQKVSRRFVLLAELKNTGTSGLLPLAPPATPTAPEVSVASMAAPVGTAVVESETPRNAYSAPIGTTSGTAKSVARSQTVSVPAKPAPAPTLPAVHGEPNKANATGRPHLRLDVTDGPMKTVPPPVAVQTAARPAAPRASAPATAETPEDAQVKALQRDLQRLLEQANTNQAALLAMQKRLSEDQSTPMPLTILYVLLALIVLSLAALAFAWIRHNSLVSQRMQQDNLR